MYEEDRANEYISVNNGTNLVLFFIHILYLYKSIGLDLERALCLIDFTLDSNSNAVLSVTVFILQ
jgi:hypothetical protein